MMAGESPVASTHGALNMERLRCLLLQNLEIEFYSLKRESCFVLTVNR